MASHSFAKLEVLLKLWINVKESVIADIHNQGSQSESRCRHIIAAFFIQIASEVFWLRTKPIIFVYQEFLFVSTQTIYIWPQTYTTVLHLERRMSLYAINCAVIIDGNYITKYMYVRESGQNLCHYIQCRYKRLVLLYSSFDSFSFRGR